jgi:hypothetical protein
VATHAVRHAEQPLLEQEEERVLVVGAAEPDVAVAGCGEAHGARPKEAGIYPCAAAPVNAM